MRPQTLPERLDDIAMKISLAAVIASGEEPLGDIPRLGFYVFLSDEAEALRQIANQLRDAARAETGGAAIVAALDVLEREARS